MGPWTEESGTEQSGTEESDTEQSGTVMKDDLRATLERLTALNGPSGFEQPVVEALVGEFTDIGAEVRVDHMGNLYARLPQSDPNGPHLMIAAHSDEVGAVVRYIDQNGFLRIDPLGIVAPVLFVGRRVDVAGHLGVVGVRPVHAQTPAERHQAPPIDQLFVDVGATSAEEVAGMGIRVGSPVSYSSPLRTFSNPDRLCGKAIDNRLGCAVLLQLFRRLRDRQVAGTVTAVAAVQEEVGLRGATVAARSVRPDYAVVIDTLPVEDTPGGPEGRICGRIGHGPVLVVASSGGTFVNGHIGHPRVGEWIERAGASCGVPVQRVSSIGYAVTDAAAVHLRGEGIPTGVLGLPRRYSHSPVCTFDINDAVGAVRLLEEFVTEMQTHAEPSFLAPHTT
jgi:putative aminopeptidase